MKHQLLLLVFLLFSVTVFAQNEQVIPREDLIPKEHEYVPSQSQIVSPPRIVPNATSRTGTVIQLGSSYNVYSILTERQNQIHYNSDLNMVSFAHRQNNGAAGGSGIISFDISADNGLTWNTSNKPITPSVSTNPVLNGNRYPNGIIWSPSGNTDTSNARFVAAGGALSSSGSNIWGFSYLSSSKLDGSDVKESYYTTPDTNLLIPGGMTILPNGDIFLVDYWINGNAFYLMKYTYDATTTDFVMTEQLLPIDTVGIGDFFYVSNWNLAFSPDGMTGYMVGAVTTDEYNEVQHRPLIYKTTDGGSNWAKLSGIDYNDFPELLGTTTATDLDTSVFLPWFREFDIVVDINGDLNIFANMGSFVDTEFASIFVGGSNSNDLWNIKTNDGTSYTMEYIHPWDNLTWSDVAGDGERWWGPRPQASRNADGSKLFFGFTMTDTLFTQSFVNQAPDFWVHAKNLTNNFDTLKNLSAGTGAEFVSSWATMAPVVIEGENGVDYEIPMVYGIPTGDVLSPINYYYLQGAGFSEDCLKPSATSTNELEIEAANIKVYPNPTDGLLNVDLNTLTKDVNIEVFNIVGQQVQSIQNARNLTTLDLSSASNGVYFIRISNDEAIISKKVIVSHN